MRYHEQTEKLLRHCAGKARNLGHSYVGSAHLLLTMAAQPDGMGLVLRQLGVDPELTESMALLLYGAGTPDLPLPQGLTAEARDLLRCAAREARQQSDREIKPHHILLAMARREGTAASQLLQLSGVSADVLFTHTMDYLRWEQQVFTRGKKEAVSTRLLEQFSGGKEFLFLTNNSGSTPKELQQKLARMGLDVPEKHFYTSALATAAFLREQSPGCSVYAIGEAGLFNALYDAGITMNDVNPDYVVMGEGKSYSLDSLTKATNLVLNGARLIGANSDVSGPIENGITPACRALVAPIEMATGTQAYFCGKPNPLMMRTGLKLLGCHSGEAVMVGDRMDTDIISGLESGMSTVLVLSGVSTPETLKTYAYRPTVVLDGVGEIVRMAKEAV